MQHYNSLTTQFVLLITFSSRLIYRLERKYSLIKNWYSLQEKLCNFALENLQVYVQIEFDSTPHPSHKIGMK